MSKSKKYLLWSLIPILLLIGGLLMSTPDNRLADKIEVIRAAGDPVSIQDLAPASDSSERNVAVFLNRAQADVETISSKLHTVYKTLGDSKAVLTDADLQSIDAALTASPEAIPLLQQAGNCSFYEPPVNSKVTPRDFIAQSYSRTQSMRSICRLLHARAQLLISRGDGEEALATCLTIFRLSRLFDREPAINGFLGALACRTHGVIAANTVLRSVVLSESSRTALDAELARHDNNEAYVYALKTERVFGIAHFESLPLTGWLPTPASYGNDECDYLDLISEQLDFAARPYCDMAAANFELKYRGRIGAFSKLLLPSLLQCRTASDRVKAQLRCLRVLNAVDRRADRGDLSKPELESLGLSLEATTDPFTGKPLKFVKTNAGWLIYSIGENLEDDGGDLTKDRDVGVRPIRVSGDNE